MRLARPVTRDHLSALMRLDVHPGQKGLVAPNSVTLAQVAYDQPGGHVWGLWDGDTPVGLLAMIDPRVYPWMEEGDDHEAAHVWRLMIAADHQGRGFGRAAMEDAFEIARSWNLPRLCVTAVPRDDSAIPFYERLGMRQTGRIVDGEVELIREA